MRLTRFPHEFEALLSERGRRVLAGADGGVLGRQKFFSDEGLLERELVEDCTAILTKTFTDLLVELTEPLPSATASLLPYGERLPKVARMLAVPTGHTTTTEQYQRGEACGLIPMLHSESYRAFVAALAGLRVDGPQHMQVFCYRPGDYAGPHTDHRPDNERMYDGYFDVHLTFCTAGVTDQLIIYERDGHLTEQRSIGKTGTVTAYRLPFWHYTTPLQATGPQARRWLVLGTFFESLRPRSAVESTPAPP